MLPKIFEPYWNNAICGEFRKRYFLDMESFLRDEKKKHKIIVPFPISNVFRPFELCPLNRVKLVIIGQDPYIDISQANGLAFSVYNSEPLPPSLKNIYKELKSDTGIVNQHGDLSSWAVQGTLLFNTVLTTERGISNAHTGIGWEKFTDEAIKHACLSPNVMVFWLMGNRAQLKQDLINSYRSAPTLIITTPHPSPLSAYKGFFWSKPFSRTNNFFNQHGVKPIDWKV